ncbi:TIM protein, partial [Nycticryphes semicollaris]|nr:TIM protein [Nycticryphes semicollaris]
MEEHWLPEEGTGQGLAQRLHQEGGRGAPSPPWLWAQLRSHVPSHTFPLSPGLAGPLRWLENCLRRAAGDREEDGVSHPVPLVPLSEENEDAMEDRHFQALLRQLGLRPPASEQESFWRIPAALTPQQLRRAAASITHHGPDPQLPPPGLLEPLGCPQDPSQGERGLGANPCPHCCSEEPVPIPSPVQLVTKRRRELNSEDEDDEGSGGCSPIPSFLGG